MTPDQIDRLAEFCRFHERGWKSSITGKWFRATEPARAWRPDESDDDCRVVLEECRRLGMMNDVDDAMWTNFMNSDVEQYGLTYGGWLMLAKPAEKCAAVLKVLGDKS